VEGSDERKLRVIIADDHPIILESLTSILNRNLRIEVVAAASSFHELSVLLSSHSIDIVILDLTGMGGAYVLLMERLKIKYPMLAVIVFSSKTDMVPEMLKAGARGYVTKQELSQFILRAIEQVADGGRFVSPVAQAYLDRAKQYGASFQLRTREVSVLKLLSDGLDTKMIADEMGIQKGVVDNYVAALKKKTLCTTRMELVEWYRHVYLEEP
jgi:two-component system NarL family response regulator